MLFVHMFGLCSPHPLFCVSGFLPFWFGELTPTRRHPLQPPLIHRFRRLEQVVMGPVALWKFHEIPLDLVWESLQSLHWSSPRLPVVINPVQLQTVRTTY